MLTQSAMATGMNSRAEPRPSLNSHGRAGVSSQGLLVQGLGGLCARLWVVDLAESPGAVPVRPSSMRALSSEPLVHLFLSLELTEELHFEFDGFHISFFGSESLPLTV